MPDPAFDAGRAALQQSRVEHAARRAAAGLDDTTLPAGVVTTTSPGRVRVQPSLTAEHREQAVLIARAVVALDYEAANLAADVAERDHQIAALKRQATLAAAVNREMSDRLAAVEQTHPEAEHVTWGCSDPCQCTNSTGLGVCATCGEPHPCLVVRAARGIPDETPEATPE
jgi:hypothetical protein